MAMEQYRHEAAAQDNSTPEDVDFLEKWKSVSSVVDGSGNCQSGGFDCNICLDFVQDPVVTLCGHLYCWPCIYKWIHCQSDSFENPDLQIRQCPVCKSEVSEKTLVPLYGRGLTTKSSEDKAPNIGIVIPRRPPTPSCRSHTLITTTPSTSSLPPQRLHNRNFTQLPQPYYPHPHSYTATLGGTTMTNAIHPMVSMFGEMVYSRIFGNSETNLYAYPNSYNLVGNTNPRIRRHVMQADKSLSRVSFFLCCCVVLCLLLF